MAKETQTKFINEKEKKPRLIKRLINWVKAHKFIAGFVVLLLIGSSLFIYLRTRPKNYQTTTVTKRNLVKTIEASGEINADEKANLHFQTLGKLAWVGVKEGDWVEKWHAIAKLDTATLEKQLKQDLNNFAKEFRDHDQALDDYDFYGHGDINREVRRILENAQFDLDNEVLDVEIRDLSLKLATLVSPISGYVTRVDTPVAGVNVAVTDTFQIVNPDSLYFETEIDESDIGLIKEGQLATIILDAYPQNTINSQVQNIDFKSSTSDSGGTVFLIRLLLSPSDNLQYRLGMNGEVSIEVDQKQDVLSVPFEAIRTIDDKTYIQVLVGGKKAEEKEIQIGMETDDYVEVLSGLDEGDVIITGTAD